MSAVRLTVLCKSETIFRSSNSDSSVVVCMACPIGEVLGSIPIKPKIFLKINWAQNEKNMNQLYMKQYLINDRECSLVA